MSTIELTREQFRNIVYEGLEDFEEVESSDWEVDYKWQHCEVIVKQFSTGKFFSYTLSRSGSPYSDYYYIYEGEGVTLTEVQKVKKVIEIEEWVAV